MATAIASQSRSLLRHSWDAVLVVLSLAHAAVLLLAPSAPIVALGVWWNSNTIAHNFIHSPFFRSRELNLLYSIYLSALLGIPQTLWRVRHLRHHAESNGGGSRVAWNPRLLAGEVAVVLTVWAALAVTAPAFLLGVYLPGYLLGLGLCFLQGHFEHARGTTSHYGWLYNVCFFNDGYHVEHHQRPGEHWTRLPRLARPGSRRSPWPPVLRWLDAFDLESLERLVLRSPRLQRFVLAAHERAIEGLLARMPPIERVTIVGGGLFPRTALILQKLLPDAALTIVDAKAEHLDVARSFLNGRVQYRHALFEQDTDTDANADLLVVPLAFIGDRRAVYRRSSSRARCTLVHDWIWNRHAEGVTVSWLLLKRLNLVAR